MRVTVPGNWTVVSNGRRVNMTERDGELRQETWLQEVPHVTYLITLAAADFGEIVHEVDGVPVRYYAQEGREADAQRALERMPAMLRFFNERIGVPYPYPRYDQVFVQDFIFGGMESVHDDLAAPVGMMRFAPLRPARGAMFSARRRLGLPGEPRIDAPFEEGRLYSPPGVTRR